VGFKSKKVVDSQWGKVMGIQVGVTKKGALADMDVVPLIDILLVLLIIFMVITPTTSNGLRAAIPQPAADVFEGPQPNPIVVQVSADGNLKINNEASSWEGLGPRLEEIFRTRAEKVAFIKGEPAAQFSIVARAIDVIHSAGIEQVGLMTERM
jgi:biopolymer transport protein TolR